MSQVSCPSCARALAVQPEMTGRKIKCPLCSNIFQVPEPEVTLALAVAEDAGEVEDPFAFGAVGSAGEPILNVPEGPANSTGGEMARLGRIVAPASRFLYAGAVLLLMLTLGTSCMTFTSVGVYGGPYAAGSVVGVVLRLVVGIALSSLLFAGANGLRRRQGLGLVITTIVFSFLIGLPALLSAVGLLLTAGLAFVGGEVPGGLVMLVQAACAGALALTLLVGGVWSIVVLTKPDVRAAFR